MSNPFLDPDWIRRSLAVWSERVRQDPQDAQAWRTLTSLEELAWQAGLPVADLPVADLPDLRPSAREWAGRLIPVGDLDKQGLELVWRDRLEGLRRELPALRAAVEGMAAELAALRAELRASRGKVSGC